MDSDSANNTIRITTEEANSSHVDDLLKRQMNMRGDPQVTRDRRQKWYFQNWLVLGIAGMVGAFIAWAIIEPFFDDAPYFQGTVSNLQISDTNSYDIPVGKQNSLTLNSPVVGSFEINRQKILLIENIRELVGGKSEHVDLSSLKNGDVVGVYLEYHEGSKTDIALARFLVRSPPPQSESRAKMSLSQLVARSSAAGMFMFSVVAGLIGLLVGAVDGIVCRLPRRAVLSGLIGLLVGVMGGFIIHIVANVIYTPLNHYAIEQMAGTGISKPFGFLVQVIARSFAWCLLGTAMGLGQGIALRSTRLLIYGLVGGLLGGLLGGMLFDPIDMILLSADKPSAHWSRLIGIMAIGLSVGVMIGLVELLARDAWLRMTQGPLSGKEFLIFKDVMTVGSSPHSDLFLFNDPLVARHHATLRSVGDEIEIEVQEKDAPLLLNNRPIKRARLRHGDTVSVGRATFVFQRRKS